jgi:hypothetical protein
MPSKNPIYRYQLQLRATCGAATVGVAVRRAPAGADRADRVENFQPPSRQATKPVTQSTNKTNPPKSNKTKPLKMRESQPL